MTYESSEILSAGNSGGVVVFPIASRAGDIKRCAVELDRRQSGEALEFWKAECRRLAEELTVIGLTQTEIHRQVISFQTEVQAELVRCYQVRAAGESR